MYFSLEYSDVSIQYCELYSLQDEGTYDHILPRWGHSATAIALCPDIDEEVVVYGGIDEDYKEVVGSDEEDPQRSNVSSYHKTSDMIIISFGELM